MFKSLSIRAVMTTTILAALLSPFVIADKPNNRRFPVPTGPSADAKETLAAALRASKSGDATSVDLAGQLTAAIARALGKLEPQCVAADRLSRALQATNSDNSDSPATDSLRTTIAEVHAMIAFEPLMEAKLPEGVPTYTPVGTIEVKQYPAYRRATAGAFFTLFRHIQRNNITMTAPVQMEFQQNDSGKLSQESMSFLYGSMDLGEIGKQGTVTVSNAEPITVVSTGVSGLRKIKVLSDSVARLSRWIEQNPGFQRAGSVRVMGYNSPFVPAAKQYFEVQIPIREVAVVDAGATELIN